MGGAAFSGNHRSNSSKSTELFKQIIALLEFKFQENTICFFHCCCLFVCVCVCIFYGILNYICYSALCALMRFRFAITGINNHMFYSIFDPINSVLVSIGDFQNPTKPNFWTVVYMLGCIHVCNQAYGCVCVGWPTLDWSFFFS